MARIFFEYQPNDWQSVEIETVDMIVTTPVVTLVTYLVVTELICQVENLAQKNKYCWYDHVWHTS